MHIRSFFLACSLLLSSLTFAQDKKVVAETAEIDGQFQYRLSYAKTFKTPGTNNPQVITVFTPSVAGIQAAINRVPAGGTVLCAFNRCDFGDAEQVQIVNKPSFTLDMGGSLWQATSTRTMLLYNGQLGIMVLKNGRVYNNSPTLPYGSKYGYFATISADSDTRCEGLEFDHLEITTPNADQNLFLFNTYRDVASNPGSNALLKNVWIHHCHLYRAGRMFIEFINGGIKYGDRTARFIGTKITDNRMSDGGVISPENYGMGVSLDGVHENAQVTGNIIYNAKGVGIEDVNGSNVLIAGNTVTEDLGAGGFGCVGISVTDNSRYVTHDIAIIGNITDVRRRSIQVYQGYDMVINGNKFRSVYGADFIIKRSQVTNNRFHATAPFEPVAEFHPWGDGNGQWTSTENSITGNTITNVNPNKPGGYGGPYQLLRLNNAKQNYVTGNFLIQDPAASNFPAIEFTNGSDASNNYMGSNPERIARSLGYGDN